MGRLIRLPSADPENRFHDRFKDGSVDDLIEAFNGDVGNTGWVRARGEFLIALMDALLGTGLDCSSFIDKDGMNMNACIKRKGKKIVPVSKA
jgi:hypothetical protein